MKNPLISIIVPVFNSAEYVKYTLKSIEKQTYSNIEIICVDDGSTDSSPAILDRESAINKNIRAVHTTHQGVTYARLEGVKVSRGEYIGFVDTGDLIDSDMYERLLSNIQKYDADISHCGYKTIMQSGVSYYHNTGKTSRQSNQLGLYDLVSGTTVNTLICSKLFSRKLFDENQPVNLLTDGSGKNDNGLLMNYLLFKSAETSVFEDFCPYQYVYREGSARETINADFLLNPVRAAKAVYDDVRMNLNLCTAAAELYAAKLVTAATCFVKGQDELSEVRKTAQKELKSFMPEFRSLPDASKTRVRLTAFAVRSPKLYSMVYYYYRKRSGKRRLLSISSIRNTVDQMLSMRKI